MTGTGLSRPTNKWFATQTTAVAAFLVALVTAGGWDRTLSIALIGLMSQAIIGYLIPNASTPGGVPARTDAAPGLAIVGAPAH